MKNDIFNFRRFGKYFASDIRTCSANFGLSLLVTCLTSTLALYALCVIFNLLINHSWSGPELPLRLTAFLIMFFVIILTGPGKCFGRITEKQYGSFWLTLPASKLEKVLSMVLISAVIIPVSSAAIFLGIDALTCWMDHTCGDSVASNFRDIASQIINFEVYESVDDSISAGLENIIGQLSNPWIYIDDFIGMTLPFLLGALVFKKHKTAKTILAMIIFSTAISIAATPIMSAYGTNLMETIEIAEGVSMSGPDFLFDTWIFRNLALLDTISDSLVNLAFLTGIYFRIKTLKH